MTGPRDGGNRPLFQALGAYAVGSWIAYQVVLALDDGLGLPEWVPKYAFLLLLLGLPVVLATSFVQHRLRDKRTQAEDGEASPMTRVLTWRRTMLAGVAAIAILTFTTTAFVVAKKRDTLFSRGVVTHDRPILLADFSARDARDSLTAVAMTESVRTMLSISRVVPLVSAADANAALERMQRDAKDGVPLAVATELAQRNGYQAVITGSVVPVGQGYLLTIDVVGPDSTSYARFSETVTSQAGLIRGFEKISNALREKVGESVKSVRRSVPLELVTTKSMPALRKYTAAMRIDNAGGEIRLMIPLLEEAVAIDSTFALAWRKLGNALHYGRIRREDEIAALTRAYKLRDKLPDIERHLTASTYLAFVTHDLGGATASLAEAVTLDPDNSLLLNNLGSNLNTLHRPAEALKPLRHAMELGEYLAWSNYAASAFALGRQDEARQVMDSAAKLFPETWNILYTRHALTYAVGDWHKADSLEMALASDRPGNSTGSMISTQERARVALIRGRFAESREIGREHDRIAKQRQQPEEQLYLIMLKARASLLLWRDMKIGRAELENDLKELPLSALPPSGREHAGRAFLYATFGLTARAQSLIDSAVALNGEAADIARARSAIALQRRDGRGALGALKELDSDDCYSCNETLRGDAYSILGQNDSARVAYERYLSAPEIFRIHYDPFYRAQALLRAGELHELAGDRVNALRRYNELLMLWDRADPELLPQVEHVRGRIREIQARRKG